MFKKIITTTLLIVALHCHGQQFFLVDSCQSEIRENSTSIADVVKWLGKEDKKYTTYACGASSGSVSRKFVFKKAGIAITDGGYSTEIKNKGSLVGGIEIIDTAKLSHLDDGVQVFFEPTFQTILGIFGEPDFRVQKNDIAELQYLQRGICFIVNKLNGLLIKVVVNTPV